MRIRVIWEGKTKDTNLRAMQADYQKRIAHFADIAVEEIAAAPQRISHRAGGRRGGGDGLSPAERRLLEKVGGGYKVFLDCRGHQWTSQEFAEWLGRQTVGGARDLAFLVGGPEGFSNAFRQEADLLLSLSSMTLTRDWARTLLLEQIYRAFTILRGYPYSR